MFFAKKSEPVKTEKCRTCQETAEENLSLQRRYESLKIKIESLETQLKSFRQRFFQHCKYQDDEVEENSKDINTNFSPFS
jgi:phage host-nuclease inhibitor protein Gam